MHCLCQLIMGVFVSERRFVDKISANGHAECCSLERPTFYLKVLLIPMWIHFFNNFVAASLGLTHAGLIIAYVLLVAHQTAWWCFLRVIYLRLQDVPRVNVSRLQILGHIPKAWNSCWCYGCSSDERLRLPLNSIYEMDQEEELKQKQNTVDGGNGLDGL